MKNKGFTLVELLAVLIVLSLIMVIAVPNAISAGKKIKVRMLNTKMDTATQAATLWAQDNVDCLTSGCSGDITCTVSSSIYNCSITLNKLAQDAYLKYDEGTKIISPVDKSDIGEEKVCISFNSSNKAINSIGNTLTKKTDNCKKTA